MKIDCTTCVVRGLGCGDCVVSVMLQRPAAVAARAPARVAVHLDEEEQAAVRNLAAAGLVPPLRLVPPAPPLRLAASNPPGAGSSTGRTTGTGRGGPSDRLRRRDRPRQWGETDIA